jgi:hypothetical protein
VAPFTDDDYAEAVFLLYKRGGPSTLTGSPEAWLYGTARRLARFRQWHLVREREAWEERERFGEVPKRVILHGDAYKAHRAAQARAQRARRREREKVVKS